MQIDRRVMIASLRKKGFVPDQGDHLRLYHMANGRETGAHAKISRGKSHRDYGDSLVTQLRMQLKLDTSQQVRDLCTCPMSGEEYVELLRQKGVISQP